MWKHVGKVPNKFSSFEELLDHCRKHCKNTGIAWEGQQFKTAQDYLGVAISITKNPNSKKVLYYHQGNTKSFGYLLEKDGKVFLVAVGDKGQIRTFHYLDKGGWDYVRNAKLRDGVTRVFEKLFEIDKLPK
jgi:hypothetical protein